MPTMLAAFLRQGYLSYRAFYWDGPSAYMWNLLIRPILFVAMFALAGRFAGDPGAAQTYTVGMVAIAVPTVAFDGILRTLPADRNWRTLPFLFTAAGNRWIMFWSRGLFPLLNGFVSAGVSMLFAAAFLQLDLGPLDLGTVVSATAAIGLSSAAFALFAANFGLLLRSYTQLSVLLQGVCIALSGAIIPTSALPGTLQWASNFLPVTAGLIAFREGFAGVGLGLVADALAREILVALAYALLGYVSFAWIEATARRSGSLEWEGE